MTWHARLSASSAHRWMLCPGSVKLAQGVPGASSEYAAAGTYAHEIVAAALNNIQPPERWLGKVRVVDDKHHIECTQEMVDACKFYVQEIDDELMPMDNWFVEVDLTPALVQLHPHLGGTADFVRYRASKKHLRVVDFKYGSGVLVEAENNVQARVYALGALLTIKKPCSSVTVTIIQPRAGHPDGQVRDWTFPSADLLDFASTLVEAAKATEVVSAPLVPGDKQCHWCPARAVCPALESKQQMVLADEFADLPALTPEKLAQALGILPAVKARVKALEEAAYTLAVQGQTIPGYKLVDKRPTRRWTRADDVAMWAQQNAVDPWAPRELLSPAQLEKKLYETAPKGAKKLAGKVLEPFIESVSSGQALVSVTDDRPERVRIAASDFEAVAEPKKAIELF